MTLTFTGIFTLLSTDSYVFFIALKSFLSNLNQGSSLDYLMDPTNIKSN
jgi:hypothetical protein